MSAALRLGLALASVLLLAHPATALAQRMSTAVDAAIATVRYGDSLALTATTLAPSLRLDWRHLALGGNGSLSQLGDGNWSAQGAFDLSLFAPAIGPARLELATTAGGSAHQDETRTGEMIALGRVHFTQGSAARRGVWVGGGGGRAYDGAGWEPLRLAEAGAWLQASSAIFVASVSPTAVRDSIRYTDARLAARFDLDRVDVALSGGYRAGGQHPGIEVGTRAWGGASAAVWLNDYIAVVASGGSYPVDLMQGFPGGRYATIGARVGMRSRIATTARPSTWDVTSEGRAAPALRVDGTRGDRRVVRVHAPRAQRVEINGDPTGWQPLSLTRGPNGSWTTTLTLPRGVHHVVLRVDDGEWLPPAGLSRLRDEFGGESGLLIVE